jgi:hypothetical protein
MNRNTLQYHQVKRIWLVLPFCLFTFLPLTAQTYTQRIQQQGNGRASVTIHQSDSIDQLVNSAVLRPAAPVAPSAQPGKHSQTASSGSSHSSASSNAPANSSASSGTASHAKETTAPDTIDTGKKMMRNGYKVMGYRVQAFAGGNSRKDRQKAEQTGNNIKSNFPDVPVYVHFYSPRWICRVGNYRTYEEAHQMLVSLRKLGYNQASIVKGKITVSY